MSTGFNAGIDSSNVVVSYAEEAVWATDPAIAFQEVRLTGEGFSSTKSRTRPNEIRSDGQASHAITTQVEASGTLNFALSVGTYDDLLEGLLNGTWVDTTIAGVAGDISAVAVGNKLVAGASKWDGLVAGQWVKLAGFGPAANNGYHRVISITSTDLVFSSASVIVDDTPANEDASVSGSILRNGTDIHTYYFQKQLAANLFFVYPGSYISSGSISASVGGFIEGSFEFLVESETKGTTDASTGTANTAPTGRVIDTVAGFSSLAVDDDAITEVAQSIEFTLTKDNARAQYGLGSPNAQGMARGTISVAGSLSTYFGSFDLYDDYTNEVDRFISFRALDDQGTGYIFTIPAATLMNPSVVAGGPDTDVLAEFELEGNPALSGVYQGFTLQIDRFLT